MSEIPRDGSLESSLALLREGYGFIGARCARLHSDVFQARLLLQNTLCLYGAEAAELFYDEARFQRAEAAPLLMQRTLLGQGGVQGLDGPAHRQRKHLFVSVLDERGVTELTRVAEQHWWQAMQGWPAQVRLCLQEEVRLILTRAVCEWAGIPLADGEAMRRRDQFVAMVEGAGAIGVRHWQGRHARRETEAWAADLVRQVRQGRLPVAEDRALAAVANHRELNGERLDEHTAAVELLNLLRPTVAVARFIVFAALELHRHPEWRERLQTSDHWLEPFAQEVRRLHAFFPFIAARVRHDFDWRGYRFREGARVLLDLYGTNRDPRTWTTPDDFRPERFEGWQASPYQFITQGGGDAVTQHRCPGERLAIELIKLALRMLAREVTYRVPEQDLTVDPGQMPSRPRSGLIISDARPTS